MNITDILVALDCPTCIDFSKGGTPEYTEKIPPRHTRDQLPELNSHVIPNVHPA